MIEIRPHYHTVKVPAEPLREALVLYGRDQRKHCRSLAKLAGVNWRTIARVNERNFDWVTIDSADKILDALGTSLSVWYPDDD